MSSERLPNLSTLRITVIDNDALAAYALTILLNKIASQHHWKHTITTLTEVHHSPYQYSNIALQTNILILDCALEHVTCIEIAHKVRRYNPRIGIIAVTSYSPGRYLEPLRAAGSANVIN